MCLNKNEESWELMFSNISVSLDDSKKVNEVYYQYKIMIKLYAESIERCGYKYDQVNMSSFIRLIDSFPIQYRIDLLKVTKNIFSKNFIDFDEKLILKKIDKILVKNILSIHGNKISQIFKAMSYNIWVSLIFSIIAICIMAVIFIPVDFPIVHLFDIKINSYANNEYGNAIINEIAYLCLDIESISIEPISSLGVILLVGFKGFFILVIANYLGRKIINNLGVDDVF